MSVSINGAGSISGLDQGFNVTTGSVGVGTDNPSVKLDIVDSGSPNIALRGSSFPSIRYSALDGTTDAEIYYGINGNDLVFNNVNAGPIALKTSNVERLRITSAGKVGIGTDDPKQFLSVVGRATFDQAGDYYGAWINGNSTADSSFNVGAWYNVGGRLRDNGNHVVLESMNTSHYVQLQPSGGNVGVGEAGPNVKLHITKDNDVAYTPSQATLESNNQIKIENHSTTTDSFVSMAMRARACDFHLGVKNNGADNSGRFFLVHQDTTNKEVVSVLSTGNVGIGTDNPNSVAGLDVLNGEICARGVRSNSSKPISGVWLGKAPGGGNAIVELVGDTGSTAEIDFTTPNTDTKGRVGYDLNNDYMYFYTNGANERLRITSAGRMGVGTNDPAALLEVRDSENTTQGNAQIRISKGVGAAAAPATITRANTYLHLGGTEWGSGANGKYLIGLGYTNDEVGTGIPAYMGFTETSVGGYTKGDLIFGTRDNTTGTNNPTERLRITSTGAVNLSSPSNTVAAGLLNVPNGSRVSTTRSNYVTGNGGVVDMARYEMIERCITSFPANNNKICAINGAPLYINDSRDTWDRYYNLPNYLLGTLTHDCINNSSFSVTLACTMTVFMGRSSTWNAVSTSGWNLIESNTSIGPFNATTRLYVKTLAAGTHSLDNDSAMYFFSI